MFVLTKKYISWTNKVDIEKGYFCFFVCVAIEEKLIKENGFLFILATDLCTCLIDMRNFLTCLDCEPNWLMTF